MRIGIFGDGKMGNHVLNIAKESGFEAKFLYKIEDGNDVDVCIDFSHPDFLNLIEETCTTYRLPLVLCTTGFNEEQELRIREMATQIPLVYTQNTSLGVTVLTHLVEEAARLLQDYDVEIIEKHHHRKVDAPSGTAKQLASAVKKQRTELSEVYGRAGMVGARQTYELGIHAVRAGSIVGEHSVIFAGSDEIIELKHEAFSRKLFASGSIRAAQFLFLKQTPGCYTMKDVLGL